MNPNRLDCMSFEQASAQMVSTEVTLLARQVYRLEGSPGCTTLTSLEGRLWVTRQGDRRDYLLKPGDSIHHPGWQDGVGGRAAGRPAENYSPCSSSSSVWLREFASDAGWGGLAIPTSTSSP